MPLYTGSNSRSFKLMNENLISPGILMPGLTLSRAQASGARSTALDADGTTWTEFNADVPRFHSTGRRLMIGGQRTNSVRNPRGEGAAAPSTFSTNWASGTNGSGLVWTVEGTGTSDGMQYVDMLLSGTASGSNAAFVFFETVNMAAVLGNAVTASCFVALRGAASGVTRYELVGQERNGVGTTLAAPALIVSVSEQAIGVARKTHPWTVSTDTSAGGVRFYFNIVHAAGAVSVPLRFAWPQLELGTFASLPILPAVGTPAGSTRGADLVSAPLSSLGIGANGACTVIGTFMLPQLSGTQTLVQIDDSGSNNRAGVFALSTIGGYVVNAGAYFGASSTGTPTAGEVFRLGMTYSAGRFASTFNGGAVAAVTGGPTSGLTTLRIGRTTGGSEMFGEVGALRVMPFAVSDAQLQSMVASFY